MLSANTEYKHYCSLHHDFSITYAEVKRHMMDIYPGPKKFLEETGPQIKQYVCDFSAAETNLQVNKSFERVFYFSNNFSVFAASISTLFEDYKTLHDDSTIYMKKIFKLKEKAQAPVESGDPYIPLIPEVKSLVTRLKQMEEKAIAAESDFKKLENDWGSIMAKIKA